MAPHVPNESFSGKAEGRIPRISVRKSAGKLMQAPFLTNRDSRHKAGNGLLVWLWARPHA
jgi:hypothetical protein